MNSNNTQQYKLKITEENNSIHEIDVLSDTHNTPSDMINKYLEHIMTKNYFIHQDNVILTKNIKNIEIVKF